MWVLKTNKVSKNVGRFLWKVKTAASQLRGVSPGWTVPVVICCPLRCSTLQNTCSIISQENPNNHSFSYLGSTFNYKLFRNRNVPELNVKTKEFFHKGPYFLLHRFSNLLDVAVYNESSLIPCQICPANK